MKLIEEALESYKSKQALYFAGEYLSFDELDTLSKNFAALLISNGVEVGDRVAIALDRSIELIVAVIATLRAGAAYVPCDISYPPERLRTMLEIARPRVLLTDESALTASDVVDCQTLYKEAILSADCADKFQAIKCDDDNPGYIIFTSGSTGTPKGVTLSRRALSNLLQWQQKTYPPTGQLNTLQFTPIGFDVSFQEIGSSLLAGGCLYLIPQQTRIDPVQFLDFISSHSINRIFLPFVALQALSEAAGILKSFPKSLEDVFSAGEQLKITDSVAEFFQQIPGCRLHNHYGPSETHVITAHTLSGDSYTWPKLPPIGKPISNCDVHVLDENHKAVSAGELYLSGTALANGYFGRDDLTQKSFLKNTGVAEIIYKTGDLVEYDDNQDLIYQGRVDQQIKIRGHRIEPGDIEVTLASISGVSACCVNSYENSGQLELAAYIVKNNTDLTENKVVEFIRSRLPEYMIPSAVVFLAELPKTPSGKIARNKLPLPLAKVKNQNHGLADSLESELGSIQKAFAEALGQQRFDAQSNFFEAGASSLQAMKLVALLLGKYAIKVPIADIYNFPTPDSLAAKISGGAELASRNTRRSSSLKDGVAVIGMSLKGPGFNNIDELARILENGEETLTRFSADELSKHLDPDETSSSDYVAARGIISDGDKFDAPFFQISPAVARLMDPQQRQLLQQAWHCFEDANVNPFDYEGLCGVYVGTSQNTYLLNNILKSGKMGQAFSSFDTMLASDKDYSATRIAHALNLKGPALNIQTACSTSLVAIISAARAIISGETDTALAGGSALTFPAHQGHLSQEGSIYSRDGHCRPFDSKATGTYFSDGAGLVLLKGLQQAIDDGDRIYAVIRGAGMNNDGKDKASFSAPHALSQAFAIRTAMDEAGWTGADMGYVECHGTATPIGDPIEVSGLRLAYAGADTEQTVTLGSIKANMGHLTAAAGVAGFIKAALCVQNGKLYPQINFEQLNPDIEIENSAFRINAELQPWTASPRRAGVSSFGVGGTNAHLVIENHERQMNSTETAIGTNPHSVLLSGTDKDALQRQAENWSDYLNDNPHTLEELALATQNVAHLPARLALVAADLDDLKTLTKKARGISGTSSTNKTALVFAFPGQGSQYVAMGKSLYQNDSSFREQAETISALIRKQLDYDLVSLLYSEQGQGHSADIDTLNDTYYTQPALFLTCYSLAVSWQAKGLKPDWFIGHSIGEIVAACLSGVFDLETAVSLICQRAKLVKAAATGSMLAVNISEDRVSEFLSDHISLAAINGKTRLVLAGSSDRIETLSRLLDSREIQNKRLHTSHAFHSAMMDAVVPEFESFVQTLKMNAPTIPLMSTVTAKPLSDKEATSARYWARHIRSTVRYYPALEALRQTLNEFCILETGPRSTLTQLSRPVLTDKQAIIASLDIREPLNSANEALALERAMAGLWSLGLISYAKSPRSNIRLPLYSFAKNLYWIDPLAAETAVAASAQSETFVTRPMTANSSKPGIKMSDLIANDIRQILTDASGMDLRELEHDVEFTDVGLDSLVLTKVALNLEKKFKTKVNFRQLNDDLASIGDLSCWLEKRVDESLYKEHMTTEHNGFEGTGMSMNGKQSNTEQTKLLDELEQNLSGASRNNQLANILQMQMTLMQNQLKMLNGSQPLSSADPRAKVNLNGLNSPVSRAANQLAAQGSQATVSDGPADEKKNFGAMAKIRRREKVENTELQNETLKTLIRKYNEATKASKAYAEKHRSYMSDPRVVSGFKSSIKEIVYPIVVNKSEGSTLWDIDGREYVDMLNGFGSNFYGYQAPFLKQAIAQQLDAGYEIGPQHELAGELSRRVSKMINVERVAWCNTGSEAVLGAMRMARTVTGRNKIVTFSGSYHGICDEVIVRAGVNATLPAAPGIMDEAVMNIVTLDYGTDEALAKIRNIIDDVAAILVEPVQSRRPEFRPVEFWRELSKITRESGAALIFDEVITGFRFHQGGVKEAFGIEPDLVTYGKIIGGGLPIGLIGGNAKFMDSLDGGQWNFGDASVPEVGVTYFAGTFVRHPLALAGAMATVKKMEELGAAVHDEVNAKADYLANKINGFCAKHELPYRYENFGSLMKFKVIDERYLHADLIAHYMRLNGVHFWDGFPTFTTVAHSQKDLDFVSTAFELSAKEMASGGLLSLDGSSRNL